MPGAESLLMVTESRKFTVYLIIYITSFTSFDLTECSPSRPQREIEKDRSLIFEPVCAHKLKRADHDAAAFAFGPLPVTGSTRILVSDTAARSLLPASLKLPPVLAIKLLFPSDHVKPRVSLTFGRDVQ